MQQILIKEKTIEEEAKRKLIEESKERISKLQTSKASA